MGSENLKIIMFHHKFHHPIKIAGSYALFSHTISSSPTKICALCQVVLSIRQCTERPQNQNETKNRHLGIVRSHIYHLGHNYIEASAQISTSHVSSPQKFLVLFENSRPHQCSSSRLYPPGWLDAVSPGAFQSAELKQKGTVPRH